MRNWLRQRLINILVDTGNQGARQRPARLSSQGNIGISFDDCDITEVEYPIVGNDASVSSIALFTSEIAKAYKAGKIAKA